VVVTVSLGVAWEGPPGGYDDGDRPTDDATDDAADDATALALVWALLDHADDLMYAAKRAGRNRVVLAS
jgi:GGDEF domain-containing protein